MTQPITLKSDKSLVRNGAELRTLIREKSGAIDPAVLPYLSRAGTHFTILKLAKDGALDNDPARFQRYVYPQQVDTILNLEMVRLKGRIDLLRADPVRRHDPLEALVVGPELGLPPWPDPPPRRTKSEPWSGFSVS